ncbi:MAG: hypothetical protein ACP5XB_15845, partial [Isosphaeraceae bacterium]
MSRVVSREDVRRFARAAAIGAAIAISIVALVGVHFYLEDHLAPRTLWRMRLVFLLAYEIAYGVIALALVVAIPLLGTLVHRAGKRRQPCPRRARLLLLAVSLLLSLFVSEAVAGVWWSWSHRASALPVGGLDSAGQEEEQPRLPAPPEEVKLPVKFAEDDKDGSIEVLVVGESSAEGVPYNWWLSIANMVTWQLEKIIPERRFHYTILANSGDTLEMQHQRLAKIRRRPDLFVIYAGHNEFTARFPWSRQVQHYADGHLPGLRDTLIQAVESCSPICWLIREELNKCHVALPPPPLGYRTLVDEPVYTQEELQILLRDFERRLDAMVSYAEQLHAKPILIVPPANDFDYEPNRSCLPPRTTRSQREQFARQFLAARKREESDPAGSLAVYQALLNRYPGFAELHYRVAWLLARSGRWEEAYRHSISARELDGFPERCLPVFQDVYRRVAARHRRTLIDGQDYFHKIGYHGLLDDHLFHDAVHPSLRGQIALAQAVLLAIHDQKWFGWPEGRAPVVIDPAECVRHFRLTPWCWEKVCDFGIMFYDLTPGLRYDPTRRVAQRVWYGTAHDRIKAGKQPEDVGMPNLGMPAAVPLVPDAAFIPPIEPR